jgi:hypothetical protein
MTHNQKVEIHHIIDKTSKEIYHFQHNNSKYLELCGHLLFSQKRRK